MDKNKLIMMALGCFTIIAVCAIVFANTNNVSDAFNPQFEEDQFREQAVSGVSEGIKIPGYSTIVVPYGASDVDVNFFNPEENDVYFEISLVLSDTDTEIYKSKLIAPGQHIYNISLNETLNVGTYNMNIVYNTYSMDGNYTPKNGASVACELEVE